MSKRVNDYIVRTLDLSDNKVKSDVVQATHLGEALLKFRETQHGSIVIGIYESEFKYVNDPKTREELVSSAEGILKRIETSAPIEIKPNSEGWDFVTMTSFPEDPEDVPTECVYMGISNIYEVYELAKFEYTLIEPELMKDPDLPYKHHIHFIIMEDAMLHFEDVFTGIKLTLKDS